MGHKIAEAIIVDGKLHYIDRKLPQKKMKVHIIYDDGKTISKNRIAKIIAETFGIYKNIKFDADTESKKLRQDWERKLGW